MKNKYNYIISDKIQIKETIETYVKKAGNKNFSKKPDTIETNIIDNEMYLNCINAHDFFKNFGSERMYKVYTIAGYLPARIVSTSPDRQQKVIRHFNFSYKENK